MGGEELWDNTQELQGLSGMEPRYPAFPVQQVPHMAYS